MCITTNQRIAVAIAADMRGLPWLVRRGLPRTKPRHVPWPQPWHLPWKYHEPWHLPWKQKPEDFHGSPWRHHGSPWKLRGHCRGPPPKRQIMCIRAVAAGYHDSTKLDDVLNTAFRLLLLLLLLSNRVENMLILPGK